MTSCQTPTVPAVEFAVQGTPPEAAQTDTVLMAATALALAFVLPEVAALLRTYPFWSVGTGWPVPEHAMSTAAAPAVDTNEPNLTFFICLFSWLPRIATTQA
jgi:hypothetical protein